MSIVLTCIAGLFAGLTGGMLGIGGSIVMIPAMTELSGPNQHLYQAAAMIMNFFVVAPAVVQHRRARAIDMTTVARLIPLAVFGVVVGVGVSELPFFAGAGERRLRGLFGICLFLIACVDLCRLWRPSGAGDGEATSRSDNASATMGLSWGRAALVALPTGLIGGLLGIGGGVMAVPLQRRLLGMPVRIAIANSAAVIVATSLIGSTAKNYAYITDNNQSYEPILLAAVLIPTAIIGSLVGARLTHALPLNVVKAAFCVLLAAAGIRFTYQATATASQAIDDISAATSTEPARQCARSGVTGLHATGTMRIPRRSYGDLDVSRSRLGSVRFDVTARSDSRRSAWNSTSLVVRVLKNEC